MAMPQGSLAGYYTGLGVPGGLGSAAAGSSYHQTQISLSGSSASLNGKENSGTGGTLTTGDKQSKFEIFPPCFGAAISGH